MEHKYQQHIDDFIDDLQKEKKPRYYRLEQVDPDLEKMFETIRAVKRLKKSNTRTKLLKSRWFKGAVAVAAALILILGLNLIYPGKPEQTNLVHAVVKAYEELQSYSGIAEIRIEQNGETEYLETIEIQYQKPWLYSASHRYNDYECQYISNGDSMAFIEPEPGRVTVENLFPEKELWRYHIGTTVWELEEAEEVNALGTETLFGREAAVLEYKFFGDQEFHRLWIDKKTNLPLRKILNHPEGHRLVVEFKELKINPKLEADIFSWSLPEGAKVRELNRTSSLEEVKSYWPDVEKVFHVLPIDMKLWKIGFFNNNDHSFKFVLRFRGRQENDFMDLYYSTTPGEYSFLPEIERGKLADGYVDLDPKARNEYVGECKTARWVKDDAEVLIASNRDLPQLLSILENLAGEKVKFESDKQENTMELYFMQVTETAFKLGKEKRTFAKTPDPHTLMEELMKGPQDESLEKIIPEGTKLLDLRVEGATAYVNFSGEIREANYGGEMESVLIDSIVWTLTQLEEIKFVQILVDGKIVETLGGHCLINKPLGK